MSKKEFDNVNIFSGEIAPKKSSIPAQSGLVAVEQSRAMAEVQAAILMARMNPRDEYTAYERIKKACRRKSLAASAAYAYPRGGKMVTGPTIRLAEVLASHWGNMTYGLKELSRKPGSSEIEAFAWDLETNVRAVRTFVVNHIRDKSSGNVALTSERDVYELVANMGQRRVRACILELIPGDIVEAAENQCKETLVKDEKPIEDRVREMLVVFDDIGVTRKMIETYLGHKIKGVIPTQLVQLTQIYKSLKDGIAKREDFFSLHQAETDENEKKKPVAEELVRADTSAATEKTRKSKKETEEPAKKQETEGREPTAAELARTDADKLEKKQDKAKTAADAKKEKARVKEQEKAKAAVAAAQEASESEQQTQDTSGETHHGEEPPIEEGEVLDEPVSDDSFGWV